MKKFLKNITVIFIFSLLLTSVTACWGNADNDYINITQSTNSSAPDVTLAQTENTDIADTQNTDEIAEPDITEEAAQEFYFESNTRIDLFSSKLNAEGKEYEINAYIYNKRGETVVEIIGEVALELCEDGEKINAVSPIIGYLGQNGKSYIKGQYEDYFKVINLDSGDVFAFTYPEENGLMSTGFFTVKNDALVMMNRYLNEEEQKESEGDPHAYSVVGKTCFMLPEKFKTEGDSVIFELDNDLSGNGNTYIAGEIPISFDFENNIVKCENEEYSALVYYE